MRRPARHGRGAGLSALAAAGVLAVSGLATAGPASPAGAAASSSATPRIVWGDCTSASLLAAKAECGMLSVPLDHAKPSGKKIKLALSRQKAVPGVKRQGVMLANPGGPGGEGLALSNLRDIVPNGAGQGYDWIGFDPRGVGESRPRISCDPNYHVGPRLDYEPTTGVTGPLSATEKGWLNRSKKYAAACGAKHGDLLRHMRTTDTIKDMELIRRALGADKISFYGFSYGTYLGQAYATLHPTRVHRMVLDGNVDVRGIWYGAQLEQDKAFEKVIQQFFGWVAKYDRVYQLGTTAKQVRAQYEAMLVKLRKKAAGTIGPSEWGDAFVRAGYAESLWPQTADGFAAAVHEKDFTLLEILYDSAETPGDDNGFAVYNAVQCTDVAWPRSYEKGWRKDGFATAASAPFMTWGNVWYNTACIYWPAPAGTPLKIDGSKAPPILIVNTVGDAATPYRGALHVRSLFPRARLVAEQGSTTHSNSLSGNTCVDNTVATYLATGRLPARKAGTAADKLCKATPRPVPAQVGFGESFAEQPAEQPAEQSTEQPAAQSAPEDVTPTPGPSSKPSRYPQTDTSLLHTITGLLPTER